MVDSSTTTSSQTPSTSLSPDQSGESVSSSTTTTTKTDANGNKTTDTVTNNTNNSNSTSTNTSNTNNSSNSEDKSDTAEQNQVIDNSLTTTIPKDTSFDVRPLTIKGEVGVPLEQRTVEYVGNDGAVTWKFVTSIPDGLTLDKNTGTISGTPTSSGSVSVQLLGTDNKGNAGSTNIVFTIFPSMTLPLPQKGIPVKTGEPTGFVVQVLGGSGTYRFSIDTLQYPNLYIDPVSGGINGTFFKEGRYDIPVKIFDGFATLSASIPFNVRGVVVNEATFCRTKSKARLAEVGLESLEHYIENLSRPLPDYPLAVLEFYNVCCKLCADPWGPFLDQFRMVMIEYGNTLLKETNYLRGSFGLLSYDQRNFVSTIYTYWRGIFFYHKTPDDFDWNHFLRLTRSQPQLQYLHRFGNLNIT